MQLNPPLIAASLNAISSGALIRTRLYDDAVTGIATSVVSHPGTTLIIVLDAKNPYWHASHETSNSALSYGQQFEITVSKDSRIAWRDDAAFGTNGTLLVAEDGAALQIRAGARHGPRIYFDVASGMVRIPTKPARQSVLKPATCSDVKPAVLPI
jgi:hypothetical protein